MQNEKLKIERQCSHGRLLLEVKNLKKYYPVKRGLLYKTVGWVKAVDGVSFSVPEGKTMGLVGESGCGKTTIGKIILGLIEPDQGDIYFGGKKLNKDTFRQDKTLRKDLQIVFQNPFDSLDPRFTVAKIIQEGLSNFTLKSNKEENRELIKNILTQTGLPLYSLTQYPHEFSGGQRQRISIARSLIINPKLLVLDEPVSSLDVSIQGQIINLLLGLQNKFGLAYLFVAHDLNVVRRMSDEVCVMYLGKIMETAPVRELYEQPLHPYTEALLSASPVLIFKQKKKKIILKGEIPSPVNPPSGCVFHTRCVYAREKCRVEEPELILKDNRFFACHYPLNG